ncbi:hypothetical protein L0152_07430 [bacterium]|nr:hypothetical protein [bacterium]
MNLTRVSKNTFAPSNASIDRHKLHPALLVRTGTPIAYDNFDRADNDDLGDNWYPKPFAGVTKNFKIVGNHVEPTTLTDTVKEIYVGDVFPDDQWAQIRVTVSGTAFSRGCGVLLRYNEDINDFGAHCLYAIVNKAATNNLILGRMTGGFNAYLQITTTWVDGDILRAEIEGTEFRVYQNGILLGLFGGAGHSLQGRAGIIYHGGGGGITGQIDDFEAGALGTIITPYKVPYNKQKSFASGYVVSIPAIVPINKTNQQRYKMLLFTVAGGAFTQELTETLTFTDTATIAIAKVLSETLSLTDSVTKSLTRELLESLIISDTISKSPLKDLVESATLTDSVLILRTKELTESIGLTDTQSRITTKLLNETLNLSDTATKALIRELLESLTLTDSIIKGKLLEFTETISLTDSASKAATKLLSEIISLTESQQKFSTINLAEVVALNDSITKTLTRIIAESIGLTDAMTSSRTIQLVETLTLSDSKIASIVKQLQESVSFTEDYKNLSTKTLAELVNFADSLTVIGGGVPLQSTSLSLPVETIKTFTFEVDKSDSFSLPVERSKSLNLGS